jgi:hypothetical protein
MSNEVTITFTQREIMANIAALNSIEIITKEIIERFDMECMGAELDLIEAMKAKFLTRVSQEGFQNV